MTDDLQEMGTVHIVDDDADVRHSLEWTLRSVGYSVSTHPSAQDFLSRGVLAAC